VVNLAYTSDEFGINYNFSAPNYARRAGDLLFFRGRVLGRDSEQPPESDRKYPIVLPVLCQRIDIYEIKIPEGYVVDELPPPVSVEYSFGKYSSRTEKGENLIRYSRTLEMRQLAVLPEQIADLSQFYRAIAADERGSVVLKRK
jgi:hypothetical protein